MNYCASCGQQLQPGAAFCSSCGTTLAAAAPQQQLSAQQGLAQASLEVQSFNLLVIVGRVVGLALALAFFWFVIGPATGGNPLGVLAGLAACGFGGILAGQWVALKVIRG